jgi:hypothetical protein
LSEGATVNVIDINGDPIPQAFIELYKLPQYPTRIACGMTDSSGTVVLPISGYGDGVFTAVATYTTTVTSFYAGGEINVSEGVGSITLRIPIIIGENPPIPGYYYLTVLPSEGSGTIEWITGSPASAGTYSVSRGGWITLEVAPGSILDHWLLDSTIVLGDRIDIEMRSDHTVKAFVSAGGPPGDLDHFMFNPVSAQTAGSAFSVTITAKDAYGDTVTSYSGTPALTYSAGSITPSSATGGFSNGVWTGAVTVTAAGSGVTLGVDDGSDHTGTSNSFTVAYASAVDHITASLNPTSIAAPGTVTGSATAYDAHGNSWDISALATWSIPAGGDGGSWSSNVYTSNIAGDYSVQAAYSGKTASASLTVLPRTPILTIAANPAECDHVLVVNNTQQTEEEFSSFPAYPDFNEGDSISLTAYPQTGYTFKQWDNYDVNNEFIAVFNRVGGGGLPVCALVFGSVNPPQEDVVSMKVHLGCTKEVSSFEVVLQNWGKKYSPSGWLPIVIGSLGGIGLCRAPNNPTTVPLLSLRVEGVECQENPVSGEFYVYVTGRCWGEQLFRKLVTKEYLNQKGEDIVKDLLNNYTTLVNNVKDTDTTYIDLQYTDTQVFEILKYIAGSADKKGVIGYDFRLTADGKIEFFPINSKVNSIDLSESMEQSSYSKDISRVRNKITVYGAATKSTPADKDALTEILSPPQGVWSAFGANVSVAQDSTVKAIGNSSVKCWINGNAYGAIRFTFNAGYEVNANLYPELAFFTLLSTVLSGRGAIALFDVSGKQMVQAQNFTGNTAWGATSVGVGEANAASWVPGAGQSGFDWTHIKKVQISSIGSDGNTPVWAGFWIDGLYFGGMHYSAVEEDSASQNTYALREYTETDADLASDHECDLRAKALLAYYKDPALSLTIVSTVLDYGTAPLWAGDIVHVVLPNENVDDYFRIDYVEYQLDAKTQTLQITANLGKEKPQLADYLYGLTSLK